jgi:hypothetical protein
MRQLVDEYSKLNQLDSEVLNVKQVVSEVSWGHNILIIKKGKDR